MTAGLAVEATVRGSAGRDAASSATTAATGTRGLAAALWNQTGKRCERFQRQ